MLVTNTIVEEA